MSKIILLLSIFILAIIPTVTPVFAQTCPTGQTYDNNTELCIMCWEDGSCVITDDFFGTLMLPFERILGGLTIVIMWGLMVSILWLRTQNPMLIGIVGVAMTAAYMTVAPEPTSNEFDGARLIGGALFAISLGISIYHLINTRLFQPPQ